MKKIVLISLLGIVLILAFATLTPSPAMCSWDFRGSLWGPSFMLLHGGTPYSFDTPYGRYPGIWMPQIIGVLFPIGWLPCWVAAKLWFVAELAGLVYMIWLVAERKLPKPGMFGLCLLLVFLFPPLYIHLVIGQISILTTVLLLSVVFLPREEYPPPDLPWWIPLFLALGLAKPQLGILVYPGLFVAMFYQRGWLKAAQLVLFTSGWLILTIVPVTLLDPGWLRGFLTVIFGNTRILWDLPTLFVQLRMSMGTWGMALWGIASIICLGYVLWLWLKRNARIAMLWSLALTPIATPYCSSWDFILMLPLLLWLLINFRFGLARLALISGVLLVDVLQITTRLHKAVPDGRNWWVPIALLAVFILSIIVEWVQSKAVS